MHICSPEGSQKSKFDHRLFFMILTLFLIPQKTLVRTLVKRIGELNQIDFLLYIGEENMNEAAFEYLN